MRTSQIDVSGHYYAPWADLIVRKVNIIIIIITACDWHCNEIVTLMKHVTKYRNMRKWMAESASRGDKITRVNSIRKTKSINLL